MKKYTFIYLASYLIFGGVGLIVDPDLALSLLMSKGEYGDVMPRMVGMFLVVLGYIITQFLKNQDYTYYLTTIKARSFIVLFMSALYLKTNDLLFIALDVVVLVGLVPSYVAYFREKSV